jgi:hypothetical protein
VTSPFATYTLIENFTVVKQLPNWTPGAVFKQVAAQASKMAYRIHVWPWEEVNARYVSIRFSSSPILDAFQNCTMRIFTIADRKLVPLALVFLSITSREAMILTSLRMQLG